MKLSIKKILSATILLPAMLLAASLSAAVPQTAGAELQGGIQDGVNSAKGQGQPDCLLNTNSSNCSGNTSVFQTVSNFLLLIVGAVSVIMLIFGGVRYVVSGGDSTAVQNAKNTILYAIVGIVISLLAYAAVQFIVGAFTTQ